MGPGLNLSSITTTPAMPKAPENGTSGLVPGDIVKVYLPAKGILFDWGIQAVGAEGGIEGQFNGEKVLINVNAQFDVASEITVFYMHLTLRDEIIAMVQSSADRVVVLDAGTHIGYMYWPPPSPYYSLDFGVLDRVFDSEMTPFPGHFLRYTSQSSRLFRTQDLRESILESLPGSL